jgi:hypothetical protein
MFLFLYPFLLQRIVIQLHDFVFVFNEQCGIHFTICDSGVTSDLWNLKEARTDYLFSFNFICLPKIHNSHLLVLAKTLKITVMFVCDTVAKQLILNRLLDTIPLWHS